MRKINLLHIALLSALIVAAQETSVLAGTTGSVSVANAKTTHRTTTKATTATTVPTTATVGKTMTGNVYTIDAATLRRAQGTSGGAETLYSQNVVGGLVPGVVRFAVGSGPGYGGQGQLSMRGSAPDQIGYSIDGVPVNRGFDFYNATSFNTNGVETIQVCTGGSTC